MKKSKLLIPLLTIAGSAATIAPIMTSCTTGEKEESHFELSEGEKATKLEEHEIAGEIYFEFSTNDKFKEEDAKLVEPVAVITTSNSYISLNRCAKINFDLEKQIMYVTVSYIVNPEAYEYKEVDGKKAANETLKFDMKIHNGTWTQTFNGFSVETVRDDKQ